MGNEYAMPHISLPSISASQVQLGDTCLYFRELCLAALSAFIGAMPESPKPLGCLDAFSATGETILS